MARRTAIRSENTPSGEPDGDCRICPRLAAFRDENRARHRDFFNAPVPSFGEPLPRLLIVGLAPGLKGANRTGRPFTGDYAGDLLYPTLIKFGWAHGRYGSHPEDGLTLRDCRITNAVRCVPPENKPTTAEIRSCNSYLRSEIERLRPALHAIVALGGVAHGAVLTALGQKKSAYKFAHGAQHRLPGGILLADSYHCSRYNTNTGRLTPEMFEAVFEALKEGRR
ncbi:MAG: uracil-DNA glycosylase [Limibacillus sp.]